MTEQFRIAPRPQVGGGAKGAPQVAVAAQPGNYVSALPAPNAELQGLVEGLSALNPALAQFAQQRAAEGHRDAALEGAAAAQRAEAPRDALTGAPLSVPSGVPPAYGESFLGAMREGLAQRTAVQNKLEAAKEYFNVKDDDGFNVTQWLAEKRQGALAGITDPRAQAIIGQHFTQLEADIAQEAERERIKRAEEVKVETASLWAADMFTPDLDSKRLYENFGVFQERAKALHITKKEASQYLLLQLTGQSSKLGGAPELFEVFDVKDAEGYSLGERNPALAAHVAQAKEAAKRHRDGALQKANEHANAKILARYETDIDDNPASVTMDRLLNDFTEFGALGSAKEVASMWGRAQDKLRAQAGTQQLATFFDKGELWRLEPGQQNKIMDARMGGLIEELSAANRDNDLGRVAGIGARVLQLHTKGGATVPFDQLKGFVKHLVTTLPDKEGPNTAFGAAAELYKALSGAPQYRSEYFGDDVSKVLDGYIAASNAGTDSKTAYVQAYQAVSPEAKKAAEDYVNTPEFKKRMAGEARKWVEGSSRWPRILGGNGRPENVSVVGAAVSTEMRSWRARNPFATDEQAEDYAEQWTAKNFVLDTTSNVAVKMPPGYSAPAVQEALSAFSAEAAKRLALGSRTDVHWVVQYVPVGDQGDYHAVAFNGSASQVIGPVSLRTLLAAQRAKKVLSEQENAALGAMRAGLRSGQLPAIDPQLLAKAEALGVLRADERRTYKDAAQRQLMDRLNGIPKMTLGQPSFDNLQFVPGRGNKVDNALTARVARELMADTRMGMTAYHQSYAASLISMGEGVMLETYEDPAQGAGRNIGMGYNLTANAATAPADLKRAGVPDERIREVLDGKRRLEPDQAKRLLLVALPRYEKQVQEVAEATSPGLWNRMTPAQKAVMIDVAWQVGSADKFKQAWGALAANDMPRFADETKVFYTDRSGAKKEDTRRNNLRASMLAGLSHWEATVEKYGALPSSKLESLK